MHQLHQLYVSFLMENELLPYSAVQTMKNFGNLLGVFEQASFLLTFHIYLRTILFSQPFWDSIASSLLKANLQLVSDRLKLLLRRGNDLQLCALYSIFSFGYLTNGCKIAKLGLSALSTAEFGASPGSRYSGGCRSSWREATAFGFPWTPDLRSHSAAPTAIDSITEHTTAR